MSHAKACRRSTLGEMARHLKRRADRFGQCPRGSRSLSDTTAAAGAPPAPDTRGMSLPALHARSRGTVSMGPAAVVSPFCWSDPEPAVYAHGYASADCWRFDGDAAESAARRADRRGAGGARLRRPGTDRHDGDATRRGRLRTRVCNQRRHRGSRRPDHRHRRGAGQWRAAGSGRPGGGAGLTRGGCDGAWVRRAAPAACAESTRSRRHCAPRLFCRRAGTSRRRRSGKPLLNCPICSASAPTPVPRTAPLSPTAAAASWRSLKTRAGTTRSTS